MGQSLAGRGRRTVAPQGNDTECVPVSVIQCVSLPLSVMSLNAVVHVVHASHTFWIFHIRHGVYV